MRVIGGRFGGRRLKSIDAPDLRPTTDRVRESLFNMLEARISLEGMEVLDLFAGTGALGIEALSRGAARCDFVESHRRTVGVLRENLKVLDLESEARVIPRDAVRFLNQPGGSYDLVLADPPYAAPVYDLILRAAASGGLLHPGGLLVLEHAPARPIREMPGLEPVAERGFGDTAILILRNAEHHGDAL